MQFILFVVYIYPRPLSLGESRITGVLAVTVAGILHFYHFGITGHEEKE